MKFLNIEFGTPTKKTSEKSVGDSDAEALSEQFHQDAKSARALALAQEREALAAIAEKERAEAVLSVKEDMVRIINILLLEAEIKLVECSEMEEPLWEHRVAELQRTQSQLENGDILAGKVEIMNTMKVITTFMDFLRQEAPILRIRPKDDLPRAKYERLRFLIETGRDILKRLDPKLGVEDGKGNPWAEFVPVEFGGTQDIQPKIGAPIESKTFSMQRMRTIVSFLNTLEDNREIIDILPEELPHKIIKRLYEQYLHDQKELSPPRKD